MNKPGFKVETVSILYYKNTNLARAIQHLLVEVDRAYRKGSNIIILSDRGVDENHVAIPSLLAVAALNSHLVQTKKRNSMSLILESGEPREVHHFATLLGYGASAVNPYLAHDAIKHAVNDGMLQRIHMLLLMTITMLYCTVLLKLPLKWVFLQFNHIRAHRF